LQIKYKILIQFIIFLFIFFIIFFLKNIYFKNSNQLETNKDLSKTNINKIETQNKNFVSNLSYYTKDIKNNRYYIESKTGEILDDSNQIVMQIVVAKIIFNNNEEIKITSDSAIYNDINFSTKFIDNINITYNKNQILSDKMDLDFENKKAIIYENVIYKNLTTNMQANYLELDMETKKVNIFMDKNFKEQVNIKSSY